MLRQRTVPTSALIAVVLLLIATACGGSGGADKAPPDTGEPNKVTIWAIDDFKKPLDTTIAKFKTHQPQIEVDVTYAPGPELNDRLLQGERPDLYLHTALELDTLADDNTIPNNEHVEFGRNVLELVVPPGNPKGVKDLTVFGLDPTTTALCEKNFACGRSATELLKDALVVPAPDDLVPPTELLDQVTKGSIDATLMFRTQTVRALKKGLLEYVPLPAGVGVEVPYAFAVVRHGGATDTFLRYIRKSNSIQKILGQSGFAPLEGDQQ